MIQDCIAVVSKEHDDGCYWNAVLMDVCRGKCNVCMASVYSLYALKWDIQRSHLGEYIWPLLKVWISFTYNLCKWSLMNAENGDRTSRYDLQNPIPPSHKYSFHIGVNVCVPWNLQVIISENNFGQPFHHMTTKRGPGPVSPHINRAHVRDGMLMIHPCVNMYIGLLTIAKSVADKLVSCKFLINEEHL